MNSTLNGHSKEIVTAETHLPEESTDLEKESIVSSPNYSFIMENPASKSTTNSDTGTKPTEEVADSSTNSSSLNAPKFKSTLLQSMLGGGRLATHAKDAVAGIRYVFFSD